MWRDDHMPCKRHIAEFQIACPHCIIEQLRAELEKERKYAKCSTLCRCEDPYSASRQQAARDCIEAIQGCGVTIFHIDGQIKMQQKVILAIKEKFGLEKDIKREVQGGR
jgi:hypothetical protein